MRLAASGTQFSDLENKKINSSRFDALNNYFLKISNELGDYPDT